jgi:hypothetical protein
MLPSDLNPDYPEGQDTLNEGDNHLRNAKTALQNSEQELEDLNDENEARFNEDGQVLVAERALIADKLSDDIDFDLYAQIDQSYPELRAQATTQGDVGLGRLNNYALSTGFDMANRQEGYYLSLGTLKEWNRQLRALLANAGSENIPFDELVEIDGTYPNLRAQATTKDDIGLTNLFANGYVDSTWFDTNPTQTVDSRTLVTPGYVREVLKAESFPFPQSQHTYLFKSYLPGAIHTATITGTQTSNYHLFNLNFNHNPAIELDNFIFLRCPDFYIDVNAAAGYDFTVDIKFLNRTVARGRIVEGRTVIEGVATLMASDDFFDQNYTHAVTATLQGDLDGTVTIAHGGQNFKTSQGVWKLVTNRPIGKS